MASFYTGNSGNSTGPHLDFRVWDVQAGAYVDPNQFTSRVTVGGKPLSEHFQVTSPYGMRTHPIHGDQRMHHGIDYATPSNTQVNFDGHYLGTVNDPTGGGISNQYRFTNADGRVYDAILMHGSDQNTVNLDTWNTDNDLPVTPRQTSTPVSNVDTPPVLQQVDGGTNDGVRADRSRARERVQNYADMSKEQINAAYDEMRASDPNKAAVEGLKMHRAYFGKWAT